MKSVYGISSFTLLVAFVCTAIAGIALVPKLPVKLAPSQELPGLTISYSMPGNSSRIIEAEVTGPLESMLSRVKGIRKISSSSGNGSGSIDLSLDKHADIDVTRFEVSTIIRQAWPQLPDGVTYPQIKTRQSDKESTRPFLVYTLNAPATPILIQQYAEAQLKPALAQLKGIYKVELSGATPLEWCIRYDQEELLRIGVTADDIRQAIDDYLSREFLGTCNIERAGQADEWIRLVVTSPSERQQGFDPAAIPIRTGGKVQSILPLSQIVTVTHTEEKPQSYYRINGLNSVYLSITADEAANQLQLGKEVKETLSRLTAQMPTGYELHISHDATEYIQNELNKIYLRTALTVAILLLFVLLITRRLRYLLLIAVSLTVNIAIAVIFYYLCGLEMQLYSLAGITISLNLVIDNTIVMADHYMRQRNLKVFLSMLAATLTTVGALSIIFFLEEKVRLNLQDFAAVVIINLTVSLLVALFFVPSLMEELGIRQRRAGRKGVRQKGRRFIVRFTLFYRRFICLLCRYRVAACVLLLLGFGLPVFLLPEKIEGEGKWAGLYNRTLGSIAYKEQVKPVVDAALGGSLRLFVQKVYNGSYFSRKEETVLYLNATLPNGSTLEQMNTLIKQMETYLSDFAEIRQFQTSIMSARRASIAVYFKKEHEQGSFPYVLKSNVITKATELGGGSWSVYGLEDQGFSNDVRENAGSFRVKLYGYNYDELYHWAEELKARLLTYRRIKEVTINSEFSWWKDDYREFFLHPNQERMTEEGITARQLYAALHPLFGRDLTCGSIWTDSGSERITLTSGQSQEYDVWGLQHLPCKVNGKLYKLSDLAVIEKEQAPQKVVKENQQYRLCLQYEYIGSSEQGRKSLNKEIEALNKRLPMGYTAESEESRWRWGEEESGQYTLLLLIIVILFFITSILFNSLKQPFAILFIIPVSYIGVFLTFYLFELNFDQGGFAAFVLLCGITVNASIYILNEYNAIRRRSPRLSPLRAYTRAWNTKIVPIFLTVVSTVLGFLPFMIGETKEAFWFPLAAGTIGGLVMSLVGLFLYLPIFSLSRKRLPRSSARG